jgi:hypothetical protein
MQIYTKYESNASLFDIVANVPVHASAPVCGGDAGSFVFCPLKLTFLYFNGPAALPAFSNTWAAYAP